MLDGAPRTVSVVDDTAESRKEVNLVVEEEEEAVIDMCGVPLVAAGACAGRSDGKPRSHGA